jgi:hypothetical protein
MCSVIKVQNELVPFAAGVVEKEIHFGRVDSLDVGQLETLRSHQVDSHIESVCSELAISCAGHFHRGALGAQFVLSSCCGWFE